MLELSSAIDLTSLGEWDSPYKPPSLHEREGVFRLSTSERALFRRCRRKWMIASPNKMAKAPYGENVNQHLWFGTGFHFALEDYFGRQIYGDPVNAFYAYVRACGERLPLEIRELVPLAEKLIPFYIQWEEERNEWQTVEINGIKAVEVGWQVDLSLPLGKSPGSVIYTGIWDRVVQDREGSYWILDYKTAAKHDTAKLDLDAQVSAYLWAAKNTLPVPIEGIVYIQVKKQVPDMPTILSDGSLSVNANQKTTYDYYKAAVIATYGRKRSAIPEKCVQFLGYLKSREQEHGNDFIRRDLVKRSDEQIRAEGIKILAEAREMVNPFTQIYPNPTRDCSWDCPFVGACLAIDDNADWAHILDEQCITQVERHPWKEKLPDPEEHRFWLTQLQSLQNQPSMFDTPDEPIAGPTPFSMESSDAVRLT